jgi:hypothetical protein
MKVHELAEAFSKMVDQGLGDADVAHVNGVGKSTVVCGWELITKQSFRQGRGIEKPPEVPQLRLFTTSPF